MFKFRFLESFVIILGVASLVVGILFIVISVQKGNYITDRLRAQGVTLGLTQSQIAAGEVVDNAQKAQTAADTLALHLKSIAPTYGALTAKNPGGKFDPTNPTDLDYGEGLNLANSFNLVVLGYGFIEETEVLGATLIVIGLAAAITGGILLRRR